MDTDKKKNMETAEIALLIGSVSAVIASITLGWNIYRDIILKAKVKAMFTVVDSYGPSGKEGSYIRFTFVNCGPGPVQLKGLHVKDSSLKKQLNRKVKWALVTQDDNNPYSISLPCWLTVGQDFDCLLPYDKDCLLVHKWSHAGAVDSFGRMHWAPSSHVQEAIKRYEKDFG